MKKIRFSVLVSALISLHANAASTVNYSGKFKDFAPDQNKQEFCQSLLKKNGNLDECVIN